MRENEVLIIAAQAMTSTITGPSYDMSQSFGYKAVFVWTGFPVGTVKMQGSLDGLYWYDIAGASQATGGASGSFIYQDATNMDVFVRPVFVYSSGSGSLNVSMAKKGF